MESTDRSEVETTGGTVRGRVRPDGTRSFLGIPYAEAPFGRLRFAAPERRTPWSGVFDADSYGPTPQRRALAEITTIPEPSLPGDDTLNLNVFAPAASSEEGRPVMVWIHGGGYVAGSIASPWYDGGAFARDGVITVVPSYRLGFDGFGWLPDAPLNRGVLDWVMALEWVRDNIAAFGGDPNRVTIAGQSAGGGAVMSLLALPQAASLFAGAISVSGVPSDVPLAGARETTRRIAARLGVPETAAGFASVDESELIAAQEWGEDLTASAEARDILRSMSKLDGTLPFGPVVDGDSYPRSVETALQQGIGHDKPLMVGATLEEFGSFFASNVDLFADIEPSEAVQLIGAEASVARDYTAVLAGSSTAVIAGRYVTDVMFRRRIIRWLQLRSGAPTWVYDFTWRSRVSGASEHCLDVPFAFDVLSDPDVTRVAGPDSPQSLADDVHSAYVSFITHGEPGWPASDETTSNVHVFDTNPDSADGYASARVLAREAHQNTTGPRAATESE